MKEYEYKVIFLGESGTGAKTSLIERFVYNRFNPNQLSTTSQRYADIFIQVNLGIIKLHIWDTVGQEKFRGSNTLFIKNSHCVVLGYDIARKMTFKEIEFHYKNAKKY